jgi:diketogulonate reductase-like aldo/keto reductase
MRLFHPPRRTFTRLFNMTTANTPITLNDGTTVPFVGFGTGTALYAKDAEKMVAAAIKAGITHLDGAQVYSNEDSLGAGILASGKPRSELFITTKLAKLPEGTSVRDSVIESLRKLKTDYLDLLLIHTPKNFPGKLKETWKELEALKAEGLTKSIGVSNFSISNLKDVIEGNKILPSVNQVRTARISNCSGLIKQCTQKVEFHPHDYEEFKPLVEFMSTHNIVVQSYAGFSPLFRVKNSPVVPVVKSIAENKSKALSGRPVTPNQVMLLWLRAKGVVAIT